MDSLRLVMKDGKPTYQYEEVAPVPHSITRVAKVSGNYGLADKDRQLYPHLVQKEGDVLGPVERLTISEPGQPGKLFGIGRGRGRGRVVNIPVMGQPGASNCKAMSKVDLKPFEEAASVFLDGLEQDLEEEKVEVVGVPVPTVENVVEPEAFKPAVEPPRVSGEYVYEQSCLKITPSGSGAKAGKASKGKVNGYMLFVKNIAKKNGVTGSIAELMKKYDAQWKELPEDQKTEWKVRAKTPVLSRERTGSFASCKSNVTTSQQNEESDDGFF